MKLQIIQRACSDTYRCANHGQGNGLVQSQKLDLLLTLSVIDAYQQRLDSVLDKSPVARSLCDQAESIVQERQY